MEQSNDSTLSFIKSELIQEITPIKGYADMLSSEKFGAVNDRQKEKLGIIQRQVDRLLQLVSKMRSLRRF
jgi:signal transduction histidine kinase